MIGVIEASTDHGARGRRTRLHQEVPLTQNTGRASLRAGRATSTSNKASDRHGRGTTDYIVYRSTIQHSGVWPSVDHPPTTCHPKIPMPLAEQLKIEHGSVDYPVADKNISLKRGVGLPDRDISKDQLCRIMNLRVEETLTFVKKELDKQKLHDYLGAGVFITGGCARLRGLEALATRVFGLPVHVGHSHTVNGPTSAIESPEYSTAIGLVRFALGSQRETSHRPPSPLEKVSHMFHGFVHKVRALF
jgi:cell division protein FtsA